MHVIFSLGKYTANVIPLVCNCNCSSRDDNQPFNCGPGGNGSTTIGRTAINSVPISKVWTTSTNDLCDL